MVMMCKNYQSQKTHICKGCGHRNGFCRNPCFGTDIYRGCAKLHTPYINIVNYRTMGIHTILEYDNPNDYLTFRLCNI